MVLTLRYSSPPPLRRVGKRGPLKSAFSANDMILKSKIAM